MARPTNEQVANRIIRAVTALNDTEELRWFDFTDRVFLAVDKYFSEVSVDLNNELAIREIVSFKLKSWGRTFRFKNWELIGRDRAITLHTLTIQ